MFLPSLMIADNFPLPTLTGCDSQLALENKVQVTLKQNQGTNIL